MICGLFGLFVITIGKILWSWFSSFGDLSFLMSAWPEMTDIINILIRCELAYHVEFGFICEY